MNNDMYIRQASLVDKDVFNNSITIIGAGAVGSFTALALTKMGFSNITVYDNDKVEIHNIPNQFYPTGSIGSFKVDALKHMINSFHGVDITAIPDKWITNDIDTDIVISAVDNMHTRNRLFRALNKNNNCTNLFVDARMGGNQLEVYTCNLNNNKDKQLYKSVLWSEDETSPIVCTEKAVIYNVLTIASWICNQIRLVLSDKEYKRALIMDLENMMLVG